MIDLWKCDVPGCNRVLINPHYGRIHYRKQHSDQHSVFTTGLYVPGDSCLCFKIRSYRNCGTAGCPYNGQGRSVGAHPWSYCVCGRNFRCSGLYQEHVLSTHPVGVLPYVTRGWGYVLGYRIRIVRYATTHTLLLHPAVRQPTRGLCFADIVEQNLPVALWGFNTWLRITRFPCWLTFFVAYCCWFSGFSRR